MEIQQLKKALENELDKLKGHVRLDINLEKSRATEAVRSFSQLITFDAVARPKQIFKNFYTSQKSLDLLSQFC